MRQVSGNELTRFDEIDRVVVVLINTRSNSKDVGIKDNVLRQETDFVDQDAVRLSTDFVLALLSIRLAQFIERHYYNSSTITHADFSFSDEFFFAFF